MNRRGGGQNKGRNKSLIKNQRQMDMKYSSYKNKAFFVPNKKLNLKEIKKRVRAQSQVSIRKKDHNVTLHRLHEKRTEKREQKLLAQTKEEDKLCVFKPEINKASKNMDRTGDLFERTLEWQQNRDAKIKLDQKAKKQAEKKKEDESLLSKQANKEKLFRARMKLKALRKVSDKTRKTTDVSETKEDGIEGENEPIKESSFSFQPRPKSTGNKLQTMPTDKPNNFDNNIFHDDSGTFKRNRQRKL